MQQPSHVWPENARQQQTYRQPENPSAQFDPQQYERGYTVPPMGIPVTGTTYQYPPQQAYRPAMPAGYADFAFSRPEPTIETRLAAVVSYLVGWLTGLVLILFVKNNRFLRFHAMQSLLFFGGYTVFFIALVRIAEAHVFLLSGFAIFAFVMMNIIACIGWFVGIIGAVSGKYVKLPFVGEWAERFVDGNQNGTVK
ncbi:hypothetical protein KDA_29380 [Dictyobacter alpinus]|uniref:DUF4870 domain-containing protein n=1 Tax=Dictyobacter alpinus TaxID=2014873 RepID=A0A402B7W2_9CHLR|nr:hypothetical protein [Dictyobacter alpinus]GCE27454.1 hypothetical protein KDA_29380 [Dictyobacter alpinus]